MGKPPVGATAGSKMVLVLSERQTPSRPKWDNPPSEITPLQISIYSLLYPFVLYGSIHGLIPSCPLGFLHLECCYIDGILRDPPMATVRHFRHSAIQAPPIPLLPPFSSSTALALVPAGHYRLHSPPFSGCATIAASQHPHKI